MATVTGSDGELVDRLVLVCSGQDSRWAFDNLAMLSAWTGAEPPGRSWDPDKYRGLVVENLMRFVRLGLREDLLVRALREELGRFWAERADVGPRDRDIRQMREFMEHARDNPVDYIGLLGASVAEVVERAESMLADSPVLRNIDADDAAERWAEVTTWRDLVERHLSDQVLGHWRDARLHRDMGDL